MTDFAKRGLACYLMDAMRRQIRSGCHTACACERCGEVRALSGHGSVCAECLRDELADLIPAVTAFAYWTALRDVVSAHRAVDEALDRVDCPSK